MMVRRKAPNKIIASYAIPQFSILNYPFSI